MLTIIRQKPGKFEAAVTITDNNIPYINPSMPTGNKNVTHT